MADRLSTNPKDEDLLAEITLLTELMIAANDTDGLVDPDVVDRILSGHPTDRGQPPTPSVPRQRSGSPVAPVTSAPGERAV